MKTFLAVLLLGIFAVPAQAQFTFKNVQIRSTFGAAQQGNKGLLLVDKKKVSFTKNNGRTEYFSIPADSIKEVFYSHVSGRRIGAAIPVTPFLLFSKGRKHYMTLSFDDGKELAGAIEFKLHKNNYRGVLRTIEEVTGLTMEYDQVVMKDTKQTVATFSTDAPLILSDTRGVDFGPYLARLLFTVRSNWNNVIPEVARLGTKGRVVIVFDIQKDGGVPQVYLVVSSGRTSMDHAAVAAIKMSTPCPPLPPEFSGNVLRLQFTFLYNMRMRA